MKETRRPTWRKSSYSNSAGGSCVEVAHLTTGIGVRDSKNPTGDTLTISNTAWAALTARLKHS